MKQLRGIDLKRKQKNQKHGLDLVIVLENVQYATNVANIFRIADAVKVSKMILTGVTRTPPFGKDLAKTSRHKEKNVAWEKHPTTGKVIERLKRSGYKIVALEITDESLPVGKYVKSERAKKIAVVLGSEVHGVSKNTLLDSDVSVHIPMFGKGASLNVGVSCAIFLYSLILAL
ncbi:MAG: TrmH family RNA methyltransferase [Candidatus Dojkabacteria bacterium]